MKLKKTLDWIGSSKKDLLELPREVQRMMGYSLRLAQVEQYDSDSKAMKGFGSADVREITKRDQEGTYRTVYTVKFKEVIYVLHVFKKKSKKGRETPKQDMDLINERLKAAQHIYDERGDDEN